MDFDKRFVLRAGNNNRTRVVVYHYDDLPYAVLRYNELKNRGYSVSLTIERFVSI